MDKSITYKEFQELCSKSFKDYSDEDWTTYLLWNNIKSVIDIDDDNDNLKLARIINDMPLKYVKIYINKDNVNDIFVLDRYKQLISVIPILFYVKRLDILNYFIECGVSKTLASNVYPRCEVCWGFDRYIEDLPEDMKSIIEEYGFDKYHNEYDD